MMVIRRSHSWLTGPHPNHYKTRCQQLDGGFAGFLDAPSSSSSSSSASHVLSTYAALSTLAILHNTNTKPPSSSPSPSPLPSRRRLRAFLLSLKHPSGDGTFRATPAADSEVDARSIYGALAVARLSGLLHDPAVVEREKLVEYLVGLQTHEGGFAAERGDGGEEAHAGFSYCALASLALLGAVDRVPDWGGAVRWAAQRQRALEGGCDGRTNKLVDACYSFWAGALPPLLSLGASAPPGKAPPPRGVLHAGALARYLLAVSQDVEGGGFVDYYHTCYALSGLAVAVHDLEAQRGGGKSVWGGVLEGRVRQVDVPLNLCLETLRAWDAACPLPD